MTPRIVFRACRSHPDCGKTVEAPPGTFENLPRIGEAVTVENVEIMKGRVYDIQRRYSLNPADNLIVVHLE